MSDNYEKIFQIKFMFNISQSPFALSPKSGVKFVILTVKSGALSILKHF